MSTRTRLLVLCTAAIVVATGGLGVWYWLKSDQPVPSEEGPGSSAVDISDIASQDNKLDVTTIESPQQLTKFRQKYNYELPEFSEGDFNDLSIIVVGYDVPSPRHSASLNLGETPNFVVTRPGKGCLAPQIITRVFAHTTVPRGSSVPEISLEILDSTVECAE